MQNFTRQIIFTIGCVLLLSDVGLAQALWDRRREDFAYSFVDTRAHRLGDQLTVIILENTDVLKRDQRQMDKSSEAAFNFDFAAAGSGGAGSSASLNIAGDSEREFDGNARYRSAQEFSDKIAVRVVNVLPNGYMVVEGKRTQIVANEERELLLSGIVRPIDVMPDNTVRSQFVENLSIQYSGCGPESHFSNQGWAARILNRVWPF